VLLGTQLAALLLGIVTVGDGVIVWVGVKDGVSVSVGVFDAVGVSDGPGVSLAVGVKVSVGVKVFVRVDVIVSVGASAVNVLYTLASMVSNWAVSASRVWRIRAIAVAKSSSEGSPSQPDKNDTERHNNKTHKK